MGRVYDVVSRLQNKNEKPIIKIDEEHTYTINTSKTNVLVMMSYIRKKEKDIQDDAEEDIKMTDQIIKMALGEEALEYINSQDMTMAAISDIIQVILSALNDTDVNFDKEEMKEKK